MADKLIVCRGGVTRFLYDDATAELLHGLGQAETQRRVSHIEPDGADAFLVDLGPSGGPAQRGFPTRAAAEEFEVTWAERYVL